MARFHHALKGQAYELYRLSPQDDEAEKRPGGAKKTHITIPYNAAKLNAIFLRFDADNDNRLNKQDLRNAFKSLGAILPNYRAFAALRVADQNGDGYVETVEEWAKLVEYASKCGFIVKDD